MAQIDASVSYSKELSRGQTAAHNEGFVYGSQNYVFGRRPEYFVYLYNVSEMEHVVSRPPLFEGVKLVGRKGREACHFVGKFPQPLNVPKGNVDSNEVDYVPQDVRRFVTDIINPDNLGINQDAHVEKSTSGGSNDLGAKGIFWSYNGPGNSVNRENPDGTEALEEPTQAEVQAAIRRMEKRYRFILNEAKTVEVSNPKEMPDKVTPELHAAAEYFGESYSWHSKQVRADYCPQCGEKIRAGAAFHKTEDGGFCVLDWDRTIKAGARTRAQAFEATEDPKYLPKATTVAVPASTPKAEQE